jgi:hypothetical protein
MDAKRPEEISKDAGAGTEDARGCEDKEMHSKNSSHLFGLSIPLFNSSGMRYGWKGIMRLGRSI